MSTTATHPFRAAVEAKDVEAMIAALAPDVVFRSPIVFKPYEGRDTVAALLTAVGQVFSDFRYVNELAGADGRSHALIFQANVGDRMVDGIDLLTCDEDGLITDFMVMVRPLSGSLALADAMKQKLAELQ